MVFEKSYSILYYNIDKRIAEEKTNIIQGIMGVYDEIEGKW